MNLILGLDPGIKFGFACLDLSGNLVLKGVSKKGPDEIIRIVSSAGKVMLVATDVRKPPDSVKKISAAFGARCYSPKKSLTKYLKMRIGGRVGNPHIRDAYSAAVCAYRKYSNRFRRLEKIYGEEAEECKSLVLSGMAVGKKFPRKRNKKVCKNRLKCENG